MSITILACALLAALSSTDVKKVREQVDREIAAAKIEIARLESIKVLDRHRLANGWLAIEKAKLDKLTAVRKKNMLKAYDAILPLLEEDNDLLASRKAAIAFLIEGVALTVKNDPADIKLGEDLITVATTKFAKADARRLDLWDAAKK